MTVPTADHSSDPVPVTVRQAWCAIHFDEGLGAAYKINRITIMTGADRFDGFTSPGLIKVSDAALRMARDFADVLRQEKPDQDWIVCFDWADSRQMRFPRPGGAMQELGPGFDLAAYERRSVPDEVMQTIDGIIFAIKIPNRVWLNSALRTIDVDASAGSGLTLR